MTTHILYLAHDLADAAIRRRVLTLKAGGATLTIAGFQRGESLLAEDPDVTTIELGRTADGRFAQRIGAVISARSKLKTLLTGVPKPDVIIARNLETLALAGSAASLFGGGIPIVYECLDIHRLLLDEGVKGRILRLAEWFYGRHAQLLITSSPAFVENYFKPRSALNLPVLLLENKVLELNPSSAPSPSAARPPAPGKPWRIGWFGALRCRKSLERLVEFARRMDGRVEIVLRGRPAYSEFSDFDAIVKAAPHIEFHGPYRNPEDLATIYDDVQFTWGIDFFEEGLNSEWLLPNRLYEGGLHGAVPIALSRTETGRFVQERGIGLTLKSADPDELVTLFETMDAARYATLFTRLASVERSQWVTGPAECRGLVGKLAGLGSGRSSRATSPVVSTVQS
ncbi:glycosyltransferase [Rhizobium sp. LCM 4573]|uniref:glycosyltransferase n=1 Tax=Rhizobium sp. LCM 4573 TaxID=1848291 RepID=UPI000AE49A50|nr:glycosyltransferase [Rhizobium sp. LCM 4573]